MQHFAGRGRGKAGWMGWSGRAALVAALAVAGCKSSRARSDGERGADAAPPAWTKLEPRNGYTASSATASPAAIDGSPVSWEELRPLLAEASGGIVLEEIMFDRVLEAEAKREGVRVSEDDIAREEQLLASTLGVAAGADEATVRRLIEDVRRVRGLGDLRYRALLRRTALMRALVADEARVTEAAVAQMHEVMHGERFRVRIITVQDAGRAGEAMRRLQAGEPFGEVAARMSTDPSAARGGIVEPISPADPSYPAGVRAALRSLAPGAISDPIAIDTGLAILLMEERLAPDGVTIEQSRVEVEEAVRLRQERAAMSRLAERLTLEADVVVYDPRLEESWRMRRQRGL